VYIVKIVKVKGGVGVLRFKSWCVGSQRYKEGN